MLRKGTYDDVGKVLGILNGTTGSDNYNFGALDDELEEEEENYYYDDFEEI